MHWSHWWAVLVLLVALGFSAGLATAFVVGQHLYDRDRVRRWSIWDRFRR